jgi:hypothetical protein
MTSTYRRPALVTAPLALRLLNGAAHAEMLKIESEHLDTQSAAAKKTAASPRRVADLGRWASRGFD